MSSSDHRCSDHQMHCVFELQEPRTASTTTSAIHKQSAPPEKTRSWKSKHPWTCPQPGAPSDIYRRRNSPSIHDPSSTSLHDSTSPTFPVDNRDQISPPGLAHRHRIASHTGRHLLPLRVPPTWHVAAVVDCLSVVCRVATALWAVRPKPRRRRRQRRRRMLPDSAAAGI